MIFFQNIKSDLPASIVVFLVAMPLCLGIALASGAPLFSGIIAGIVGGLIVSVFSGSPLGVSGPAAGLAVIVLTSIQELGAFDIFLLAVVIAGLIQIALGFLKAGVIGYYFPSAVIKGMLAGIGVIIFLKQIPHAFGYDKNPEGDLAFIQADGQNTLSELVHMMDFVTPGAMIIAGVSLFILILWERPFMKALGFTKLVQGPLVAVVSSVLLGWWFSSSEGLALSQDQLVSLPVFSSMSSFYAQMSFPDFSAVFNPQVWVVAGTIAVVASLETLLCVEATDKLDPYKRVTPTNRELVAQGIGNTVSGLIGGLPVTQVIVRSSANIQSGGKSKASAFFHGVLLLISVITIPLVLNMIPLASLAAILLVVGYKLAKPSLFKSMYAQGMGQFIPFVITVGGIVFTDLLIGISMGMIVAFFQILWNNYKTPYHFDPDTYKEGEPVVLQFSEDVSFLNKAGLLHTFDMLPNGTHLVIDKTQSKNIHPDILEIIEDFKENAKTRDIKVEIHKLDEYEQAHPVRKLTETIETNDESKDRTVANI